MHSAQVLSLLIVMMALLCMGLFRLMGRWERQKAEVTKRIGFALLSTLLCGIAWVGWSTLRDDVRAYHRVHGLTPATSEPGLVSPLRSEHFHCCLVFDVHLAPVELVCSLVVPCLVRITPMHAGCATVLVSSSPTVHCAAVMATILSTKARPSLTLWTRCTLWG